MKKVGYYIMEGWKKPMLYYSWRCKDCGMQVINYISGYSNLICPICVFNENRKDNPKEIVING